MKRFYKHAATEAHENGIAVVLDGRPVRTPGRHPLRLPTAALADAVAAEWEKQGETIEPATMPLTQLASTALDRIAPQPAAVSAQIARYAETDLVCYRADTPASLVERQRQVWVPLLKWLEDRYGAKLLSTAEIQPIPQPAAAIAAVQAAVAGHDHFRLAVLSAATAATGSAVIGLALADRQISGADAADAAFVDENYQMEQWGADDQEEARLARLRAELTAAERFLSLLA
ncbi:MAG TPA: ATP12 family protein [Alphaproteobacteria bacterium]|nr:ATP12 family protein [Alphaproteobacteria bacterium]